MSKYIVKSFNTEWYNLDTLYNWYNGEVHYYHCPAGSSSKVSTKCLFTASSIRLKLSDFPIKPGQTM